MPLSGASYSAVELAEDGTSAFVLDQRLLPEEERYRVVRSVDDMATAIRDMVVRGAPAIGIAAAYGMAIAAHVAASKDAAAFLRELDRAARELVHTRPTAVNLAWAVRKMLGRGAQCAEQGGAERARALTDFARCLHSDEVEACRRIGAAGAARLPAHARVITHCNAGALATGGFGTALGVVRAARAAGKTVSVIAGETRPYLQGARLTAWELARDGFDVTVVTDGMAAHCMARGMVDVAVVGADRIARSGDVANKIGTYGLACLCATHTLPFYVAAPWSTVDLDTPDGTHIPIEERSADEVVLLGGRRIAPVGARVYHPGFDVTPARLVHAIFTETGELRASEEDLVARHPSS